jgi:hypothetical protein
MTVWLLRAEVYISYALVAIASSLGSRALAKSSIDLKPLTQR